MSDKRLSLSFIRLALTACFLIAFMTPLSTGAKAMGEKYTDQGGRLTAAINEMLISKGFCKSARDCNDFLPGYVGHGDQVRIAFYQVNEKNHQAFSAIIELVIKDGIRITGGVPIAVTGYRETQEEYRRSGVISKNIKPFLILEINK